VYTLLGRLGFTVVGSRLFDAQPAGRQLPAQFGPDRRLGDLGEFVDDLSRGRVSMEHVVATAFPDPLADMADDGGRHRRMCSVDAAPFDRMDEFGRRILEPDTGEVSRIDEERRLFVLCSELSDPLGAVVTEH
jgi:hypothetical protein